MRLATKPTRPFQAAIVKGTIETVARERFRDKASQSFHFGLLVLLPPQEKGSSLVSCSTVTDCYFRLSAFGFRPRSRARGRDGNSHRASTQRSFSGIRLPEEVSPAMVRGSGAGPMNLATRRLSPSCLRPRSSHPWLETDRRAEITHGFRPIPVRRNSCARDCKVTPVYCTCQEGNTIGCIPSNDGLDARLGVGFPHQIKIQGFRRFPIAGIETWKR